MKEPLSFYGTDDGLKFYLINCGSGLTHLIIFPDETVMLFDCNLVDDAEHEYRNKDYILSLLGDVIPEKYDEEGNLYQPIDIFVNSHRDTDHLRGLKDVNGSFPIQSIWDSGQRGASTDNENYQYYMRLRNTLKSKNEENLVVPTPSDAIFASYGGADIYVLSDANDFISKDESALLEFADKKQHTNCMVLLVCYADRKMLLTGDSDWIAWRDNIVPNFKDAMVNYKDTDILIASHHGSRTFFTNKDEIDEEEYPDDTYTESIKFINPKVTLISCGDYETYHHPSEDAVELYKKYTSYEQVYTTNNLGTFVGRINSAGFISVTPRCFTNYGGSRDAHIYLKCVTDDGLKVENDDSLSVGQQLHFSVVGTGGVLEASDNPSIIWQVCNSGNDIDDSHHEIYYKSDIKHLEEEEGKEGKNYFSRELSYRGTHLLRCKVINRKKRFKQQMIFVVHGE